MKLNFDFYGKNKKYHSLDICFPADRASRATVINVHGGGYVYGSTVPYKFYCCYLASKGYTVISFNYRLAPKFKFPSPLEDINLVADLKVNYGYTPFIPSKFVYLLFTDRPIVAFGRKDSWMYQLSKEYPEAGIGFADVDTPGELADVMEAFLKNPQTPDRKNIQKIFTGADIVNAFIEKIGPIAEER